MINRNINQLIELIYEAAIESKKMDRLAGFIS